MSIECRLAPTQYSNKPGVFPFFFAYLQYNNITKHFLDPMVGSDKISPKPLENCPTHFYSRAFALHIFNFKLVMTNSL